MEIAALVIGILLITGGIKLVQIIETTVCDRSISRIESDYRAMRPKNDRTLSNKEGTK